MPARNTCPRCGAELADYGPGGLCPRCLLRDALECDSDLEEPLPGSGALSGVRIRYFGDYELIEELGHGGMGVVYKARQISLNRLVALKLIQGGEFASPEFIQRFRLEAETAARLHHPNIIAIYEVGEHEGQPYFSMDYVDGPTLEERVRKGPMAPKAAANLARILAQAIHYAHQQGVLHRDLKPSNVLIDPFGQPRITDFGLAKVLTGDSDLTLTGQPLGSPGYMAPEQAAGKTAAVGPRSDVYALGALLYHLLTGRAPFQAETLTEVLRQVREAEAVSPRLLNPSVPRDLETICLKCLEKEPAQRYESAEALAAELGRFVEGRPILARPVGRPEKLWRWCRRQPVLASLAAALVLVLILGLAGVTWQWREAVIARERADESRYAADIQLAQTMLELDEYGSSLELLEGHLPQPGETDRRGWEWRFLRGLLLPDSIRSIGSHQGEVKALGFLPGDRLLTACLGTDRVAVWDYTSGALLDETVVSSVYDLAIHPQGRVFAVAAYEPGIRLYDAASLRVLATLPFDGYQHTVRFSPQGRHLACLSKGRLLVWELTWGVDGTLAASNIVADLAARSVWAVAFAPDGESVAYCATDVGKIALYSISRQRSEGAYDIVTPSAPAALAFSPTDRLLASAAWDGSLELINLDDGHSQVLARYSQSLRVAAFSPDGGFLMTAGNDGPLYVWNVAERKERSVLRGHVNLVSSLAISSDGNLLASGSKDRTCRLWKLTTAPRNEESMRQVPCRRILGSSPNGRFLLALETIEQAVLWDLKDVSRCQSITSQPITHAVHAVVDNSGLRALVADSPRTLFLWDVKSEQVLRRCAVRPSDLLAMAWSHSGAAFATLHQDGLIAVCDAATGDLEIELSPHAEFGAHDPAGAIAFCPGDRALYAVFGRQLLRHDLDTGEMRQGPCLADFTGYGTIDISSDGTLIACASIDDRLRLWDARTFNPLLEKPCEGDFACVAFGGGSSRVFVGIPSSRVAVLDTKNGLQLACLRVGDSDLRHLQFCSASDTLAVYDYRNRALHFWRAPSLHEIEVASGGIGDKPKSRLPARPSVR